MKGEGMMILLIMVVIAVGILLTGLACLWMSTQPRASRPNPAPPATDRQSARPYPDSQPLPGIEFERWISRWQARCRSTTRISLPGDTSEKGTLDASAAPSMIAPAASVGGNSGTSEDRRR